MKFFIFLFFTVFSISYAKEKEAILEIYAGKNFVQNAKIGVFSFKTTPQMVFWVESEDGNFKKTIWMTRRFAKQEWAGQSYDKNKTFREYTFPRWMKVFKGEAPTKNKPLTDAVTGASPTGSTNIKVFIPSDKKLNLFFEVNNAFDENKFYPQGKLYDGQPSLVYFATIEPDFSGKMEFKLKYKTSISGELIDDLEGITTAKDILSRIVLVVK